MAGKQIKSEHAILTFIGAIWHNVDRLFSNMSESCPSRVIQGSEFRPLRAIPILKWDTAEGNHWFQMFSL